MNNNADGVGQAEPPRDHLVFFVNGAKHVIRDVQPQTTLLQFLRRAGLTGTKLGCGEGGCGACTVMVSAFDYVRREIRHTSVNACLAPLVSQIRSDAGGFCVLCCCDGRPGCLSVFWVDVFLELVSAVLLFYNIYIYASIASHVGFIPLLK